MNRTEHLLTIAGEECAEVAQRLSKAARFGLLEVQEGQGMTNAERIVQEYHDLRAVLEMLEAEGRINLSIEAERPAVAAKKEKVEKYLLYAAEVGTLEKI